MKTIINETQAQIELKKSKFIAVLCPYKDFKDTLARLKKEHIKAVHFVYAFRHFNEFHQIIEDKSDDKEPKNTAALPCLNVLRGAELCEVAVIVVRYFGGIKLGTGGLIRAYTQAAHTAILNACLSEFEFKQNFYITLPLQLLARFEHFILKHKLVYEKSFQDEKVKLKLELNTKEQDLFESFAKEYTILLQKA